jgi:flagellar biogenesis protein FliO
MTRSLVSFVALGALALLTTTSVAQGEPTSRPAEAAWLRKATPKPAPRVETKAALSPLRVGAMLSLVAALGGFAFYARRRRVGTPSKPKSERLDVLSSTRLGPKAHAVVTQVSGKKLLLGVTDQSVSVLAWLDSEPPHAESPAIELDEPSELAELSEPALPVENPTGFLRLLRNAVGSSAASPAEEVARATQDHVQVSRRAIETRELVEGQAAGILRRKRAPS